MRIRSFPLSCLLAILSPISPLVGSGFGQECTVSTTVRLIDKHGQPVSNITVDQLRAEVNGKPASIGSFSPADKPGVILLLDTSPSMKGTWQQSVAAARQLLDKVRGNSNLFTFGMGVGPHVTSRSQSEELLDRLSKEGPPKPPGGTALYDTLVQVAGGVTTSNVAIVVISDGGDNASHHSSDATVSEFLRSSWPSVFALILDYEETNPLRSYFKKIPAATGGLVLYPTSASKVPAAADELAAAILNPFAVKLQLPKPITGSVKMSVTAVRPDGKRNKDIEVLHPAELVGCDSNGPTQR